MGILESVMFLANQELEQVRFVKSIMFAKVISLIQQILFLLLEGECGSYGSLCCRKVHYGDFMLINCWF